MKIHPIFYGFFVLIWSFLFYTTAGCGLNDPSDPSLSEGTTEEGSENTDLTLENSEETSEASMIENSEETPEASTIETEKSELSIDSSSECLSIDGELQISSIPNTIGEIGLPYIYAPISDSPDVVYSLCESPEGFYVDPSEPSVLGNPMESGDLYVILMARASTEIDHQGYWIESISFDDSRKDFRMPGSPTLIHETPEDLVNDDPIFLPNNFTWVGDPNPGKFEIHGNMHHAEFDSCTYEYRGDLDAYIIKSGPKAKLRAELIYEPSIYEDSIDTTDFDLYLFVTKTDPCQSMECIDFEMDYFGYCGTSDNRTYSTEMPLGLGRIGREIAYTPEISCCSFDDCDPSSYTPIPIEPNTEYVLVIWGYNGKDLLDYVVKLDVQ